MELNREQIIKALHCCKWDDVSMCKQCPYYKPSDSNSTCISEMSIDALALIYELIAENKLINVELGNANSEILRLIEREKELTEENERLRDTICSQYGNCGHALKKAKADTVKKMQERIKAEKFHHKNFGDLVYMADIDRIAKEMLEGDNGSVS